MASQISGHLASPSYESIATSNVSTATPSVTFSSIPAGFTNLQIRGRWTYTGAGTNASLYLNFNGDTATNYAWHRLGGLTSSVQSDGYGNEGQIYVAAFYKATNYRGQFIIDIPDYLNTSKYKTIRSIHAGNSGANGYVGNWGGVWRNTAAITSITIADNSGNIEADCQFALYGTKVV
jgi:hypothetical protein